MVLTSLGDLWIFESKESKGSYNLLLLIPWFDEILYHSMLELCDFLMIYINVYILISMEFFELTGT